MSKPIGKKKIVEIVLKLKVNKDFNFPAFIGVLQGYTKIKVLKGIKRTMNFKKKRTKIEISKSIENLIKKLLKRLKKPIL